MRKRLVYICSPCRGDIEKNIEKAQRYCREAVELWDDVIPIAPHVYFTQFLDDTKQEERAAGMDMGLSLLTMCDELWVYGIENPSEGMRNEIEYAKQHQIPIRDAAELYRNREVEALPIGDALIVLPSHVGNLNGVAAIESTTVRINGEMILDLAIELRRHPGHDITLEADKSAKCAKHFTPDDDGLKQDWGGIACSAIRHTAERSQTGYAKATKKAGSPAPPWLCSFLRGLTRHIFMTGSSARPAR